MRFDNISIRAWKETRDKWIKCLVQDFCDWRCCSICTEMGCKYGLPDECKCVCPLTVSDWCHAQVEFSRLHRDYTSSVSGAFDTNDWEHRVMNYLEWIGLEIEAMEGWQ